MREHDFEPVRGLPERLPEGERLLWQGAPTTRALARRAMHVDSFAVYFASLLLWLVLSAATGGGRLEAAVIPALRLAGLGLVALGLLTLFAWLVSRSTIYTITSRRVVIRYGVALAKTINLPFAAIEGAALKAHADGTGEIPLTLTKGARVAYPMLWPHVRPWRLARPQPMLRAVPEAAKVAQILGRALAAAAAQPVQAPLGAVASGAESREPAAAVTA